MLRLLGASLLLSILQLGCGSGQGGESSACAAEAVAACKRWQKGCVDDGSGARCDACDVGTFPDAHGTCAPIAGTRFDHDFGSVTIDAGKEIPSLCQVWTIGNDEVLWANAVEFVSGGAYHHSNYY